jgi:hypothetical protein
MLTNTEIPISNPSVNQIVFFKPWQGKNDKRKKAYPVIINSGNYLSNGLISNFWYWQRITPLGNINSTIEHGYGNFTEATGYNKVERKIIFNKN